MVVRYKPSKTSLILRSSDIEVVVTKDKLRSCISRSSGMPKFMAGINGGKLLRLKTSTSMFSGGARFFRVGFYYR